MTNKTSFFKLKRELLWIAIGWKYFAIFIEFFFAFLEMHQSKIVAIAIMTFCCFNVNALHMFIVILLVLSFPLGSTFIIQTFHFIAIYLAFLLLTKMIYQTKCFPKILIHQNCTGIDLTWEDRFRFLFLDFKWMGYQLLEKEEGIKQLWGSYMLILLVMTLNGVVCIRQRLKRLDNGKPDAIPPVLYPQVTRQMADEGILLCAKYLLNYGFYKFGVEITLTVAAMVIAYRMDVLSAFYSFWLLFLFPLRRAGVARLWRLFFASIILSILWQYAMSVGLSPLTCLDYPWGISEALSQWFFLASYDNPPDATKILADFLLLISVWRQKLVFDIEKKDTKGSYPGGSNKEVFMEHYDPDFVNPVPDQTAFNRSLLHEIINFIITSMLWVTFALMYWTGVNNVNILSLGYLVGVFIFLWIGHDIFLWRIEKILKWWNILLAYTIIIITIKSVIEVAGCVYYDFLSKNVCWLVQLLSLACANLTNEGNSENSVCLVTKGNGLYWDAVCFGLLLFQRRIFFTYYFLHQVEDFKSIAQLQSKGTKLIEKLIREQITESENKKKKTLEKIKKSMNRIKEWQRKIHGPYYLEPTNHAAAVRMGDYFMFEEFWEENAEIDELESSSSEESDDDKNEDEGDRSGPHKEDKGKEKTMSQFLGTLLGRNISEAFIRKRKERKEEEENEKPTGSRDIEDDSISKTSRRAREDSERMMDKKGKKNEITKQAEKDPKLKSAIAFLKKFVESICVSMIRYFDKHSRDYRYIDAAMKEERNKNNMSDGEGSEEGRKSKRRFLSLEILSLGTTPRYGKPWKRYGSGVYVDLILSFSLFVMCHTEFFCYMVIFIHQALSPTILSLPLPLCALLWGSLTTIRPTATFWVVIIAYIEVTVLIKAIFQNWIFPWNTLHRNRNSPYNPPFLLGIDRRSTYATADLVLLFTLFLHRYKLKRLGMWKQTNEEEAPPPRNYGVYKEVLQEQNYFSEAGLEQELDEDGEGLSNRSRLPIWKCTSRAMAARLPRGGKILTKVRIREIEGNVLVTEGGRRLMPIDKNLLDNYGDVMLRVHPDDGLKGFRDPYCKLSCLQHFTPVRKFFMQIMDHKGRISADFYTFIFFSQFCAFLIVFFGYPHFVDVRIFDKEEHFYFVENQVPLTYLLAVLLHFFAIIIDRILYLRKNVVGKLILQITLVMVVHFWMFIILPRVTESPFTELTVPQIYYLIKCLYFLMSSYQMREGYPMRVQGHFLCKKYGYLNYFCYKALQFIPFFNQLRTLLSYVCIKSSLSIMEWIKMESIYQHIYEIKCVRKADEDYPTERGIIYPKCKKYFPGIFAVLYLVFIIWFPFFLFAIFETVSLPNKPQGGVIELAIGSFGEIYKTRAIYENIIPFKYSDFSELKTLYSDNRRVWSFLVNYEYHDVTALKFRFRPSEKWRIMKGDFDRLNETIQAREVPIRLYLSWKIMRTQNVQTVGTAVGVTETVLGKNNHLRDEFARAFRGEQNKIFLKHMLPKFIAVNNDGGAIPVGGFFGGRYHPYRYRNITLQLVISNETGDIKFWELTELHDDESATSKISKIPYGDQNYITLYAFNQKSIPKTLLRISRAGIIGLYLSIVLVFWTFVRRFMTRYPTIMFDDMPNVDRVLQLCHDVYLARESHEFALEEDLYAKLIFLFRSPETMIKWTRTRSGEEFIKSIA